MLEWAGNGVLDTGNMQNERYRVFWEKGPKPDVHISRTNTSRKNQNDLVTQQTTATKMSVGTVNCVLVCQTNWFVEICTGQTCLLWSTEVVKFCIMHSWTQTRQRPTPSSKPTWCLIMATNRVSVIFAATTRHLAGKAFRSIALAVATSWGRTLKHGFHDLEVQIVELGIQSEDLGDLCWHPMMNLTYDI